MKRAIPFGVAGLAVLLFLACRPRPQQADSLGPNAACYVCHMTFVGESLSKEHRAAGVACVRCHGLSAGHANDENIGATKPDVLIKHDQVSAFCRTCHAVHDAAPEKVVARWQERGAGKAAPPICTDCHGRHKIARAK